MTEINVKCVTCFRANGCELCGRRQQPGLSLGLPVPRLRPLSPAHDDRLHRDRPRQRPGVQPGQERAGGPHWSETQVNNFFWTRFSF